MLIKLLRSILGRSPGSDVQTRSRPNGHGAGAADLSALLQQARNALETGDLDTARRRLDTAIEQGEDAPAAVVMLATVLAQQGGAARAEALLTGLLERHPTDPDANNALGNVLRMRGRLDAAIEHYDRAIALQPDFAVALSNRALCQHELGHFDGALAGFRRAIEIDPHDLTALTNLAALEYDLGQDEAARIHLENVLRIDPGYAQAHWVLAFALLRNANFEQGWPEYEWRDRDAGRSLASPALPEWHGEAAMAGPLLVCAEQGLGDQIMFSSCIDDLVERVDGCVLECDPRLVGLFARSFPEVKVYPHWKKVTQPWLDHGIVPTAKTWLGSLPQHFRPNRAAFPSRRSYLTPDPAQVAHWRERLGSLGAGIKIGISWRGGTPSTRRASRSIPLTEWLPILRHPGIHVIDLQYGDHTGEIEEVAANQGIRIHHWAEALAADYDATAALVAALDLVVSVQTSIVHLAGALGKDAWVLVPRVPEWRYGSGGEEMPWYPSVRLIRQAGQDWNQVMTDLGEALRERLDQLRHSAGTYL